MIKSQSIHLLTRLFWMMGDNRHRSEDSRFWGFVPEDHIVGKPVFIWFSISGINDGLSNWKVRWNESLVLLVVRENVFHTFHIS